MANDRRLQRWLSEPYQLPLAQATDVVTGKPVVDLQNERSIAALDFPAHGMYFTMLESYSTANRGPGIKYTFACFTFNLTDSVHTRTDLFSFKTDAPVRSVHILPEAIYVLKINLMDDLERHVSVYNFAGRELFTSAPDDQLVDIFPKNADEFTSLQLTRVARFAQDQASSAGYSIIGSGSLKTWTLQDGKATLKAEVNIPKSQLKKFTGKGRLESEFLVQELRHGKLLINNRVVDDVKDAWQQDTEVISKYSGKEFCCQLSNDDLLFRNLEEKKTAPDEIEHEWKFSRERQAKRIAATDFTYALPAIPFPLCDGSVIILQDFTAHHFDAELKSVEVNIPVPGQEEFAEQFLDHDRGVLQRQNPQVMSDLVCTQKGRIFGGPVGFFAACRPIYNVFREESLRKFFVMLAELPMGVWRMVFEYYFTDSPEFRNRVCEQMAQRKALTR